VLNMEVTLHKGVDRKLDIIFLGHDLLDDSLEELTSLNGLKVYGLCLEKTRTDREDWSRVKVVDLLNLHLLKCLANCKLTALLNWLV
jgi:hypothetical protein